MLMAMILIWAAASGGSSIPDLGPSLQQIGIGVLIAVPAYVAAWKLWQDRQKKDSKIEELLSNQIKREKELSDRLAPLLATAAEVLAKAPGQFDQALSEAHSAIRSSEMERAMERVAERLETTLSQLKQQSD